MTQLPTFPKKNSWRLLGRPIGWLYGLGVCLHRAAYVYGPFKRAQFEPLVIAVGNLSVGGTGKSPHVLYVQRLLDAPKQTAMVSRGYGRATKGLYWVATDSTPAQVGDEPLQFKQAVPAATVVVAERRAAGIQAALDKVPALQYILLDDALQHWGVQADCKLLLTTFETPFFQQELLPFGRLREFKAGYRRADVLIVSKCPPQPDAATRAAYRAAIAPLPRQLLLFSWLAYQGLYELQTKAEGPSLTTHTSLDILLLTGIATPQTLGTYLLQQGHRVAYHTFPDHHAFTWPDLQALSDSAHQSLIITTEKDATKLRPLLQQHPDSSLRLYVLPIQVVLSTADERRLLDYLYQAQQLKITQKKSH